MNRLVREHYPVAKLPDDLREGFEGQTDVRVTIDVPLDTAVGPLPRRSGSLDDLFALGRPTFATLDDIDAHLRSLRGEWD